MVNHNKHWTFEDIASLMESVAEGKTYSQIARLMGRSTVAIGAMKSLVVRADQAPSIQQALDLLATGHVGVATRKAILEYIAIPKANNGASIPVQTTMGSKLEALLGELDRSMESFKELVVEVITEAVQVRTGEVIKEKEAELTSYKTVVEAAKKKNLVTTLKNRLMEQR